MTDSSGRKFRSQAFAKDLLRGTRGGAINEALLKPTIDSKKMEYWPGAIYAKLPSLFLVWGLEDGRFMLASSVWLLLLGSHA